MPLSDLKVRTAKPTHKKYRLFDEKGMYLEVTPTAAKYWRLKYRFAGKEKLLALGVFPRVTLQAARQARDTARAQLAKGVDPGLAKRFAAANTFEAVAREWHEKQAALWDALHAFKVWSRIEKDILPRLGGRVIGDIEAPDLLSELRRIEARGAAETAHRVLGYCGQIFRYAVATGRARRDPAGDLRGALTAVKEEHRATITEPKAVGQLLRAISGYEGLPATKCALRLAPLLFVRPGELRRAQWQNFDLDAAEWRIPSKDMKMREQHMVPLSLQAVAILRELHEVTAKGAYLFPSVRTGSRPMSDMTVNAALRRLGYGKDDMTGHGFRSMASTLLNEQGWNRDAIERQLAHAPRDKVRGAYNFAEYLPERRRMMQAWGDYLDRLTAGAEVVKLRA